VEKKKTEKEWEKKIKELNDLKTQIKKLINKLKGNHQTLAREFIEIRKERGNIDDKWKNFYNLIIAFKVKGGVNKADYETDFELYRNQIVSKIIQLNDRLADLEELTK
jgi:CRISPR/Cas system-associated endonuclease Cas3-HD